MTNDPKQLLKQVLARSDPGGAYLANLKQQTAERLAQRAMKATDADVDPLSDLRTRITQWHRNLAPELRQPYYFMADLKRLLRATPQALGTALHELGWSRRRVWTPGLPFRQRWYPPDEPATGEES